MRDHQSFFRILLLIYYCLFFQSISAFVQLNISKLAYNYVMNFQLDGQPYSNIVSHSFSEPRFFPSNRMSTFRKSTGGYRELFN